MSADNPMQSKSPLSATPTTAEHNDILAELIDLASVDRSEHIDYNSPGLHGPACTLDHSSRVGRSAYRRWHDHFENWYQPRHGAS